MPRTAAVVFAVTILTGACGAPTPTPTAAPSPTPAASATGPLASATPSPTASAAVLEINASQLNVIGGCGDVFIQAITADGTAAITIQWDGPATAAWANAGFSETAQVHGGHAKVSLVAGHDLTHYYCTDIGWEGSEELSSALAIGGTVELVVRPDAQGFKPAAHADVRLSDVTFDVPVGTAHETWHLDELVIQNVSVGWFAG